MRNATNKDSTFIPAELQYQASRQSRSIREKSQDINRVSLFSARHSDSFLSAFIGGSAAEELRKAQSRSAKRKEVGLVPFWTTFSRCRQPWLTLCHFSSASPKGSGRKRHDFSSPTTPKVQDVNIRASRPSPWFYWIGPLALTSFPTDTLTQPYPAWRWTTISALATLSGTHAGH